MISADIAVKSDAAAHDRCIPHAKHLNADDDVDVVQRGAVGVLASCSSSSKEFVQIPEDVVVLSVVCVKIRDVGIARHLGGILETATVSNLTTSQLVLITYPLNSLSHYLMPHLLPASR
ncbi:hypothetical protein L5515_018647 [Caenorhabditis briggsae]|uniref:Uncharacterized protein n=1 Tax=Caenorhabditis briggsae TaxID=6238 RepID=A0AAE9FIN5_CAEBR|nr:hypothetical protein L5515_018647 [Caenorhabditis briggsae]